MAIAVMIFRHAAVKAFPRRILDSVVLLGISLVVLCVCWREKGVSATKAKHGFWN